MSGIKKARRGLNTYAKKLKTEKQESYRMSLKPPLWRRVLALLWPGFVARWIDRKVAGFDRLNNRAVKKAIKGGARQLHKEAQRGK